MLPDILANAGGVTASYFEWVQDRMGYFWNEAEVNRRLDLIMSESFRRRDQLRQDAQGEQPHRGLYAGRRPRGVYDPAAGNVCVEAVASC